MHPLIAPKSVAPLAPWFGRVTARSDPRYYQHLVATLTVMTFGPMPTRDDGELRERSSNLPDTPEGVPGDRRRVQCSER